MQMRRVEVSKVQAYGNKTVFVSTDGPSANMGTAMQLGMAAGLGSNAMS